MGPVNARRLKAKLAEFRTELVQRGTRSASAPMPDLFPAAAADLAWPLVLALAWLAGELGHRWPDLPRISLYGLVGFLFGHAQLGVLPPAGAGMGMLLANVAFGLILFEFGYRINLRWLRTNPWLGATGLLEAVATFAAVYLLAAAVGHRRNLTALLLASLAMSTSPAAVMRVINEQRSSGQVTERVLHLAALNCVLSVFAFKVIVGFWTFQSSGQPLAGDLQQPGRAGGVGGPGRAVRGAASPACCGAPAASARTAPSPSPWR